MLKYISLKITGHDLKKYSPGIGPNSWGYIRILAPYQGLFFDASVQHDLLYSLGGTEKDKIFADEEFYSSCLKKSTNFLQKSFSWLYYYGVKKQGYRFFNYH